MERLSDGSGTLVPAERACSINTVVDPVWGLWLACLERLAILPVRVSATPGRLTEVNRPRARQRVARRRRAARMSMPAI